MSDIGIWWIVIQLLGVAGLPITLWCFRALPDRGYAFSKSMGLLLTSYGAWLLAMLGIAPFGVALLVVVALVVAGVGWFLLRRPPPAPDDSDAPPPFAPRAFLRQHAASIVAYEVLFALALLLLAWMRSHNPHPWGTERPMDFAFFNAIQRSNVFPPHDPWLAGYSINYYYFGYLMMAAMALLSGLESSVAFNLSLALVFALTALNVAGVLSNMLLLSARRPPSGEAQPEQPAQTKHAPRLPVRLLVMGAGVVLVLFAANQAGALQVLIGDHRVVALDGRQLGAALTQAARGQEEIVLPHPVKTGEGDFGTFTTMQRSDRVEDFNWWWPSRALWDELPLDPARPQEEGLRLYNITEFPFFSFWLGDMHPHVMSLPFTLLALALALATLARPDIPAYMHGREGWADLILAGLILGSLYIINSWDLPTYVLLFGGVLLVLHTRHADPPGAIAWKPLLLHGGMVVLALVLLFAPFYLTFHSLVGEAEPLTNIPLLSKFTQIMAPYHAGRTGLHTFLVIFGLFAVPLVAFAYLIGGHPKTSNIPDPWAILPWLGGILLLAGVGIGFPLLALVGVGGMAFYRALRRDIAPAEAFALLVVALGSAICFGTELMFIRDVFNRRMNTIFKFYYQVWLLWGTVTPYALWWIVARAGQATHPTTTRPPALRVAMQGTRVVGPLLFALLLAGALVYPAINLYNMATKDEVVGLEGETPRQQTPAGAEAIRWLREHVPPGSVLLESVAPQGGSYNPEGYGGVSATTGIPTVIGWTGHERQWRGGHKTALDAIEPRKQDVETIYSTPDAEQARQLLDQYGVHYVYVGELERRTYAPESLAKFAQIAEPVFQAGEVTVYKVRR